MSGNPEETKELILTINKLLKEAGTRLRLQQKLAAELNVTLLDLKSNKSNSSEIILTS